MISYIFSQEFPIFSVWISYGFNPKSHGAQAAMKLEGAVIAVTGGASGLGAATAQLCTEKGAKVAVLDMNKAPARHHVWWCPRSIAKLVNTMVYR